MSSFARTILVLAGAIVCVCVSSAAQPAVTVTPPAPVKSPVALFRELLAMSPAQRSEAIAIRPPDIQKRILEKLNEYELLPPELRDLRLRETELRWYLRPLMDEPRTNRAALVAQVPEELRGLVEDRLQMWDLLPPPFQQQMKNDDLIGSYFAQIRSATPQEREAILATIPADRQAELKNGLDHWNEMSDSERRNALTAFNKWFELTPEQKEKTLDTVSDDERREMKETLSSYAKLTLAQRAQCIRSFEKFAGMSIAERQQFLKNAERWREMTPEERQKWRQLVSFAPLLPPMTFPHPNPARTLAPHAPTVATN
jgi:hypothetical protein